MEIPKRTFFFVVSQIQFNYVKGNPQQNNYCLCLLVLAKIKLLKGLRMFTYPILDLVKGSTALDQRGMMIRGG